MIGTALFLLALPAVDSFAEAAEEVRVHGLQARDGLEFLRGQGRKGLWYLHAAAEKASGDEKVRLLHAMGALPFEGCEWTLRKTLELPDPAARRGALLGLSELPGDGPVRWILQEVLRDDRAVREAAARALAARMPQAWPQVLHGIEAGEGTAPLLRAVRAEADRTRLRAAIARVPAEAGADARVQVLEAIGDLGGRPRSSDLDRLRLGLSTDTPEVVMAAVRALDRLVVAERGALLAELAARQSAPELARQAAVTQMRRQGCLKAVALAGEHVIKPVQASMEAQPPSADELALWVDLLRDVEEERLRPVAAALRSVSDVARALLVARLADDGAVLRARAYALLVEGGRKAELIEDLERHAHGPDSALRAGAVYGLVEHGGQFDVALKALRDADVKVRRAAARSLVRSDAPKVHASLERQVGALAPDVQVSVLEAYEVATPAREALARSLLTAPDADVRRAALQAVAPVSQAASLDALLALMPTASAAEKALAVQAIGASKTATAGEALVELVTDPDPEVRRAALQYVASL